MPISDLVGLIRRQAGLFVKFGLWSLSTMNASLLAVESTLLSIPSFAAMIVEVCCFVDIQIYIYIELYMNCIRQVPLRFLLYCSVLL